MVPPEVLVHVHVILHIVAAVVLIVVVSFLWLIVVLEAVLNHFVVHDRVAIDRHTVIYSIASSFVVLQVLVHLVGLVHQALAMDIWSILQRSELFLGAGLFVVGVLPQHVLIVV